MKKRNNTALRWMSEVAGRQKLFILLLMIVQAVIGIMGVVYALAFREVIDSAAGGERTGFIHAMAFLFVLAAMQIAVSALGRYILENTRASLENRFKRRLFRALLRKDYADVSAVHSGEWMNRLTSDTAVTADGLTQIVPGLTGTLVRLVGAAAMIMVLQPKFGYILFPGGAVMIAVTYALRKKMKRLHKNIQEKDGVLRSFLQENLGSMLAVRSFAAEDRTETESCRRMEDHKAARMKRTHFSNICSSGFAFAMNGAYLFGLGYCGAGIMRGEISYGTLVAILQLISQVQSPFANISGYLPRWYAMTASAERLMEAESLPDDCPDGVVPLDETLEFYENDFCAMGLENAEFTYTPPAKDGEAEKEKMPVVLSGVSLEIRKGEYAAFTGQSGCGKSTVFKLLMCLYPLDGGERYITSADGSRLPLTSERRRLFAYVPQGNQLMSGTIREVVAFSDEKHMYDEERLWNALEVACADGFVRELKDGADTLLGERGQGLSEGQLQRIAIARAVFSANPVLMLDESTSALDEETEKRLLDNLRSMTDKTVLIVTHRPAALEICDKVVSFTEYGVEIVKK